MKVAVVGSGISGLGAAWILSQHHEVHLFEADGRLGGHAHTVTIPGEERRSDVAVDTGFLVYNELTYPHFKSFLRELGVRTVDSDMTLSIQTQSGLEWAGTNLRGVFAQKRNLLNRDFLKMLADIMRFHREADENLELARKNSWTLGELVRYRKMSESFLNWYLLPMSGAIWSMSNGRALDFPAETFMNFCLNHRLLQVNQRPVWKTIEGGSINYVQAVARRLRHIHLNTPVEAVSPASSGQGLVVRAAGSEATFDRVVLATHAPVSHRILESGFAEKAALVRELRTSPNRVLLHSDAGAMPKRRRCWSAWNVRAEDSTLSERPVTLTYYLNRLQPLRTRKEYFITLNPAAEPCSLEREFEYHHPQFDARAIEAQKRISSSQGLDGIYLAGAWMRYGFHEDGLLSAVNVGRAMGIEPPWSVQ